MPKRNYRQKTTGQAVKGVTTHLGVLSKPALIFWGYRQGMDNFERLMAWIAEHSPDLMEELKQFRVQSLYEKRDKAADAGTLGHLFIENHLKGLPDPKTDGISKEIVEKAEGCYLTFLDWEKANIKKVIGSEIELTCEQWPYGGTIDHIIESSVTPSGMVDILDIKTGKDIYLDAKLQVRAYKFLWESHHSDQLIAGFHILRLGENGEFTHKYFPQNTLGEGYFDIFLNCVRIGMTLEQLGEKL